MEVAHVHDHLDRTPPQSTSEDETLSNTLSRVVEGIVKSATDAVADRGLGGLSMDDVAARAGCSRATVYRRVGGKEALRDAVLDQAMARVTAAVAHGVDHLEGDERVIRVIVASLNVIRTDAVSSALLTVAGAGEGVSSALITQFNDVAAQLAGLDPADRIGCELISRVTLSLLCWPAADPGTELAIVMRYVANGRHGSLAPQPSTAHPTRALQGTGP